MDTKQAFTCTGHFVTPKYYRYENLLLEVLIWINGAGFWRPSVSGLLTFLQNISPSSCFFSFANHLISNIRCDKDNSGMPMFISPMLRCTFVSFTRWALTSRPDKVFISHPAPTQPLHISTFAATVNLGSSNQNNVFYRNLVIRQLIHSFASWREFPGSFPGIPSKLLFPPLPSFIRNPSSNQKSQFFKDVWLVTSWSTWPGKIGSICTRTWDDQAC